MAILAGLGVAALYVGRTIFVPLAVAILLTFVLAPLVRLLRSWRVGRVVSVAVVVILAVGLIFGLGSILGQQVVQLAENLPKYQSTIEQKIQSLRGATAGSGTLERASDVLKSLGREIGSAKATVDPPVPRPPGDAISGEQAPARAPIEIRQPDLEPLQVVQRIIGPLLEPLATTGIIVIFVIFILLQREDLRDRLIKLAGSHDLQRTTAAIDDAGHRLSRYFLAQTALNACFGVIIGAGLWLIGVPNPAVWGILAMVLRFVPYVGAFIAAAFPLALAAAVDPGWSMVLWTLALFLVVEPLIGQGIEPLVYGRSTGLSPIAVVVAATFWTWMWGPIGLLLSTPLTMCLGVLGRHVDRLQFLDVMFGDQAPLSPEQSFYQRTLAGDPDEAVEQAEQILKEKSVLAYYDDVALKGLRLAQIDARRGVLSDERMIQMKHAVEGLIIDLADYDDVSPAAATEQEEPPASPVAAIGAPEPAPRDLPILCSDEMAAEWRAEQPVLCVAGRSPLDEAAAAVLAQLLQKHGIGARLASQDAISPANIGRLESTGTAMVCLSYLDVGNSAARVRYAIRRIRRQFPDVPVLAGLWGLEGEDAAGLELRTNVKADLYASSLRRAVGLCIEAARTEAVAAASLSQSIAEVHRNAA